MMQRGKSIGATAIQVLLLVLAGVSGSADARDAAPVATAQVESRTALTSERFGRGFGGISGIVFDSRREEWLLLSDDRSGHEPARFYRLKIERDQAGELLVRQTRRIFLRDRHGAKFPRAGTGREAVDPEAIRVRPDGDGLTWSSEGDALDGHGPAVRHMDRRGRETGRVTLPNNLRFDPAGLKGPRDNRTIEGIDFTSDGALWLAMEAPLVEDGPEAGIGRPAPVRFTRIAEGEPIRQFAYLLDPIPVSPQGTLADNGISEILALDDRRLLVLERSGAQQADGRFRFHCRLYLADFRQAVDVAHNASLADGHISPAEKTLLLDFDELQGQPLGNLEGMAWWPDDGHDARRHILFVNDNGFETDQPTELLLLSFPLAALRGAAN